MQRSPWRFPAGFAGLLALALIPFLAAWQVIGLDYPIHLSMLRVFRLWFEDRARFDATFGTRLLQPYWGMYAPALAFSSLLTIEHAAKLVTGLGLVGFPVAVLRLADRIGADRRVALLAIPLMYNVCFFLGFIPFLCASTLALLSLPDVLDFAEQDSRGPWIRVALWSLLICVSHAVAFLIWVVWYGWILLTERRPRLGQWLRATATLVAPALFLWAWLHHSARSGNISYIVEHPLPVALTEKLRSISGIPEIPLPARFIVLALLLVAMGLAAVGERPAELRQRQWRFVALAAGMLAAYLIVPQDVAGLAFIYERFLPFFYFFALVGAAGVMRFPRTFVTLTVGLVLVQGVFQWLLFQDFDGDIHDLQSCLQKARPGSSLVGLIGTKTLETSDTAFLLHGDAFHTVWNLGPVLSHTMVSTASTPVYWKHDAFHNAAPPLIDWHPEQFSWQQNGQYIDYFLVREFTWNLADYPTQPLKPDALFLQEGYRQVKLACAEGMWRLWENTRPVPP
jgi:hypothetical protein